MMAMWLIAFRDLQMRRRRFAVAILAVGLVFGITLMLDGFDHSLTNEVRRTVGAFKADSWLVPSGSTGPVHRRPPRRRRLDEGDRAVRPDGQARSGSGV